MWANLCIKNHGRWRVEVDQIQLECCKDLDRDDIIGDAGNVVDVVHIIRDNVDVVVRDVCIVVGVRDVVVDVIVDNRSLEDIAIYDWVGVAYSDASVGDRCKNSEKQHGLHSYPSEGVNEREVRKYFKSWDHFSLCTLGLYSLAKWRSE